jgi:peroxidase
MPALNDFGCSLGPREQLNLQTAWLDLSDLYGFNKDVADKVRLNVDGLLRWSDEANGELLAQATSSCSNSDTWSEYSRRQRCFVEGDPRVEDNAVLTSIHTVWLREHNRIARQLKRRNPCWPDEKLYQQTRRIVIAQFQNIVYGEYLPALLGRKLADLYDLVPLEAGYFHYYTDDLYPQVINEFSAAAFPYGHSQVTQSLHSASKRYELSSGKPISFYLFNNEYYKSSMDSIIRGTLVDWSYAPNTQASEHLTDWLWDNVFKLDSERSVLVLLYSNS